MQNYEAIVAGAGIWGCTIARRLAEAGKKVLVLEKRPVVGGNVRCEIDPETGIEIHTYGSHIFHTSNEEVWNFVNRFSSFNDYRHMVLANHRGKIYHLPIGCTLLKEFFGRDLKPSELGENDRKALFDAFIRGYTSKQWGVSPERVDPSIIARLKVRDTCVTDYFDDPHQGIPLEGYNKLFENLLAHPNIQVRCNCALAIDENNRLTVRGELPNDQMQSINRLLEKSENVFYSGPIDALFDYKYGALPWRTLRFETDALPCPDYQSNSVVNYPDIDIPYTRIHEFKHYHPEGKRTDTWGFNAAKTVVMREYSATWQLGDEPYYPIATPESAALLAKYQQEVEKYNALVIGGRLGQYKYFDMDKSIAAALELNLNT